MCRVTMGHLRVTIGHLRVTIGHLRVILGSLSWLSISNHKANTTELHPKVRKTCLFLICILYGRVLRDKDCLNDKYDLVYRQSFNVSSELCGGRFQKVERT